MPLNYAIVHGLTLQEGDIDIHLNDQPLALNDATEDLIYRVKSAFYGRTSKQYGCFDQSSRPITNLIQECVQSEREFLPVSHQIVETLAAELKEEGLSCHGYWLMFTETLEQGSFFWIANVSQKNELMVSNELAITPTSIIDFSKLGFVAQVNMQAWQETPEAEYLTLGYGFGDRALQNKVAISLGFTKTVDQKADTEAFMDVVKAFSETMPKDKGMSYQKKAAELCFDHAKSGDSVAYSAISDELSNDAASPVADSLTAFVAQHKEALKERFIPDPKSLKKFIRYSGKSKDVSISFSNDTLGDAIEFDPQTEQLVIKKLPPALLKQLKQSSTPET